MNRCIQPAFLRQDEQEYLVFAGWPAEHQAAKAAQDGIATHHPARQDLPGRPVVHGFRHFHLCRFWGQPQGLPIRGNHQGCPYVSGVKR